LLAAERGYGVVVNYAEIAKAAGALVERIESRGGEALAIRADVSSETAIRLMFAEIARKAGPLQQVNCAGSVRRRPSGRRYRRIASTG
jgi:NAD(P)-dependent dehydrogenase (short-subunit alcohol dehydrogenase family)